MLGRQVLVGKPAHAAGQRRCRVVIQRRPATDAAGDSGFPVETWTTLATEFMSRQDVRADERFRSNQLAAAMETQWHMNYRADMDPELVDVSKLRRLSYEGRFYDILAASLIGNRRAIELITIASTRA